MKSPGIVIIACLLCISAFTQEVVYRAALVEVASAEWQAFHDSLQPMLEEAGYVVTALDFDALCDPAQLDIAKVDLLVLPDASILPAPSTEVIHAFLKQGGDIAAFNTPMWRETLVKDGGDWISQEAYQERHKATLLEHIAFDFGSMDLAQWTRTSDDMTNTTTHTVEAVEGQPFDSALRVDISRMTNWDTFVSPERAGIFPEGHDLTVFWAKGSEFTDALLLEWVEQDGSRWLTTVELSDQWQQYVLAPEAFTYWESVPSRKGTVFNPAKAHKFAVGLAHSHLQIRGKEHRYHLSDFGTARRTPVHDTLLTAVTVPELETLSPEWKFYLCGEEYTYLHSSLPVFPPLATCLQSHGELPGAKNILSSYERPNNSGYNKGRTWAWIDLINAAFYQEEPLIAYQQGSPGTFVVHFDGVYKNGVWASFSIGDPEWYTDLRTSAPQVPLYTFKQMRKGIYLIEGGSEKYTYFERAPVKLGARVFNASKHKHENIELSMNIGRMDDMSSTLFSIFPGELKEFEEFIPEPDEYTFRKGYRSAYASIDFKGQHHSYDFTYITNNSLNLWTPPSTPSFITVENGDFMLNGKRWRPHGVNYMPSSGVGLNRSQQKQFEQWLSKESYDPEIIQRDLDHLHAMGVNSLSIFLYHESVDSMNLIDLLRRMDELDMKANLSLRPGTPLNFRWEEIKEMIVKNRLAENDTVYLYDLAWEPMHHDHKARMEWDGEWREWIVERYGSIANAEADWGVAAPRDPHGNVTNPLDDQMLQDGDHRIMVAAYRRFLDTLLYKYYSRARRLVKSVDPNHLVSFRMTLAGDPTMNWGHVTPYHFDYLAGAVDVLEPEAYGRIGDWEKVKPGWFTYTYGRWANPKLPIIWGEAGVSAWSRATMSSTQTGLDFQATFFTDMYKMIMNSEADGIYWWWYPGGYRTNEDSDYGIINPDGSDRPVTKVIRNHAEPFLNVPTPKPVDYWITMDRDKHVKGIVGIYDEVKDEFWQAIADGKTPGLRTAGTGTTSQNCPLIAVGNTEWNGNNPLKYMDAFFDVVEVLNADGNWQEVEDGGTVTIDPAKPVQARITVTNLGEATWLSRHPVGGRLVNIAINPTDKGFILPHDLKRFESVTLEGEILPAGLATPKQLTLHCELSGDTKTGGTFGPLFDITLTP